MVLISIECIYINHITQHKMYNNISSYRTFSILNLLLNIFKFFPTLLKCKNRKILFLKCLNYIILNQ